MLRTARALVLLALAHAGCGGASHGTFGDVTAMHMIDHGDAFPRGSWDAQTRCGREPSQARSVCGDRGAPLCYREGTRWMWGWACRPESRPMR